MEVFFTAWHTHVSSEDVLKTVPIVNQSSKYTWHYNGKTIPSHAWHFTNMIRFAQSNKYWNSYYSPIIHADYSASI